MGNDRDGFARAARLEKAKPTEKEERNFKSLVFMLIVVLFTIFVMGIVGSSIIFWRIFG